MLQCRSWNRDGPSALRKESRADLFVIGRIRMTLVTRSIPSLNSISYRLSTGTQHRRSGGKFFSARKSLPDHSPASSRNRLGTANNGGCSKLEPLAANLRTIGCMSRETICYMLICCCVAQAPEKQHRKSVAFSDGTTEIHQDGKVTEVNGTSDKTSAESHTTCKKYN